MFSCFICNAVYKEGSNVPVNLRLDLLDENGNFDPHAKLEASAEELRKKVEFTELFEIYTKDYLVVTFLSILDLAKKQELNILQDNNFNKIYLEAK